MKLTKFTTTLSLIIILSCNDSVILPKQNAFLRIEFEEPNYKIFNQSDTFPDFYYNSNSVTLNSTNKNSLLLNYNELGINLDLKFNKLNNGLDLINIENDFKMLLETHSKRSNGVIMREYENIDKLVFGKLYELQGDVASPVQFFLTDSLSNFIQGSVNINSKSKYDSIFPAIQYVKKDISVIFESIYWN